MDNNKDKILLIGVGGIGSWFADMLDRILLHDDGMSSNYKVTIMDFDTVEHKNLSYQNFTGDDLFQKKAEVIGKRYGFNYFCERLTSREQLEDINPDIVVLAVDNDNAREVAYEYCEEKDILCVDCRAKGRQMAVFTGRADEISELEQFLTQDGSEDGSCQADYHFENGQIDVVNITSASVGLQKFLNEVREEKNDSKCNLRV